MKTLIRWTTVCLTALVGLLGFLLASYGRGHVEQTAPSALAPYVKTMTLRPVAMLRTLRTPGTIRAWYNVTITPDITGYVSRVLVENGTRVEKGELLATIQNPEVTSKVAAAKAMTDVAKANIQVAVMAAAQARQYLAMAQSQLSGYVSTLRLARIELNRERRLASGKVVSQQSLEQAANQLEVAEANVANGKAETAGDAVGIEKAVADVEAARASYVASLARLKEARALESYTRVVAPFSGVITRRMVDPGDFVTPATGSGGARPLFAMAQIKRVRIFVSVPESDVRWVHPGSAAVIHPFGLPGSAIHAVVANIAQSLKLSTRTMRCEIDVANPDGRLYGGMYATVVITEQSINAVAIPAGALVVRSGKDFVFLVRHQHALLVPVQTGFDDGVHIQITQGLNLGDRIVVAGQGQLVEGMLVHAEPPTKGS
ncbi:MAG: efflux RND transporter periplasmic adaptor subunit [Phycisphaerae bacterium]